MSMFNANASLVLKKQELKSVDHIKDNLKNSITEELDKVSKMPIIKEMHVTDVLKVNIGEVKVKGLVKVGTKKQEDGIEVPVMEEQSVSVGEITFSIGSRRITVEGTNKAGEYYHPHASYDSTCFGELETEIYDALGSLNLVKLMSLLYSWAYSYNPEDCHQKLQYWYDKNNGKYTETEDDENDEPQIYADETDGDE